MISSTVMVAMRIKELQRNPIPHLRCVTDPRCDATTLSTGTWYFDAEKHRCSRFAVYRFGRQNLCKLHAGDKALYLMLNQKED